MSKKSFSAAAEAATQALLNAQRVDASVITDECGNVAIPRLLGTIRRPLQRTLR